MPKDGNRRGVSEKSPEPVNTIRRKREPRIRVLKNPVSFSSARTTKR